MAKIIAISNQKGGVGKTTTSVNLAACLGKMGKKTLLVDADPQGNATSGVAIDKSKVKFSTYSILVDGAKAEQCVLTTPYDNLHILPSSLDLAAAELEIAEKPHREALLKNNHRLSSVTRTYHGKCVDGCRHISCADSMRILCT